MAGLRFYITLCICLFWVVIHAAPTSPDSSNFIILKGKITKNFGKPVYNALIQIKDEGIQTHTDTQGRYVLLLPKKEYQGKNLALMVKKYDFYEATLKITLKDDRNMNVNLWKDLHFHPFYKKSGYWRQWPQKFPGDL